MKRVKEIFNQYNELGYIFLIDYLLFTNNLSDKIGKFDSIILTPKFLNYLQGILNVISNECPYPEETLNNMRQILDYIENNSNDLNEQLDACYKTLENVVSFSNYKYVAEFNLRKNNLESYRNNEYYVWKKDDMKEAICFDFIVHMSLNSPNDKYIEEYLPRFILNKNYIYCIKKFISVCPDILKIEKFKKRIEEIIKIDLELLEEYDMDTISEYIKHNYHLDKDIEFNIQELEEFKKEVQLASYELNHINLEPFDLSEFKAYYQMLMLEQHIYFDREIDVHNIDLNIVYKFIEENGERSLLNKNNKEELLNVLSSRKQGAMSLQEFNYYLVKLNRIQEIKESTKLSVQLKKRATKIDYIKSVLKCLNGDISLFVEIANTKEYDLENFSSFIVNDEKYEMIKKDLKQTYFPISINKFIEECPSIFMDPTVYERTMEILNSYNNTYSKKAVKKLQKMMKRL